MIRNLPIPTDPKIFKGEFYEYCCDKVISIFSSLKEIISIYRFGSIQSLGNSDIDFIFVVKKTKDIGNRIVESFKNNFTNTELYIIFQHDPMILTESLMPYVYYIREPSNLNFLYGKPFDIENNINRQILCMQLAELIIGYYHTLSLKLFPEVFRWPLQIINVYKFILKKAINLGYVLKSEKVENILYQNKIFRESFHQVKSDQIISFSRYAFPILRSHAASIEEWLALKLKSIYIPWPLPKKNYRRLNKIFLCEENEYINYLARKRNIKFHSTVFTPLFFEPEHLPHSIRFDVLKRLSILQKYQNFLYNECNNVGLYRPWFLSPRTLNCQLHSYMTTFLVNYKYSYLIPRLFGKLLFFNKNI